MNIIHWFHHLLNPHCLVCREDAAEKTVCQSCETLKMQLAIANSEKKQFLETILALTERPKEAERPPLDPKIMVPKAMSWNIRRQMMEAEDRKTAQLMAEQRKHAEESAKVPVEKPKNDSPILGQDSAKSIEELERELGVAQEEVKT